MAMRAGAAAAAAMITLLQGAAWAQPAPPTPAFVGWRDGFVMESEGGDNRLQISALVQADGRFALNDEDETFADTLLLRRVRPILQGRLARYFEFHIQPDFAGGSLNLRNAWIETRFSPAFRLRVGKDKQPFGLERLVSSANLLFVERAFPSSLTPDRDVGIQILGDLREGTISYAAGVFNGVIDNASADTDTNDGKDLAGRIVVRPFATDKASPLAGLGVALGGTRGTQPAALPSFRTPLQQTFFAYRSGARGDGVRTRVSPQAFYYYKGFGAFTEYVRSNGGVDFGGASEDLANQAWQIAASFVLTGETASDRNVRPRSPFDPAKGTWGALQIAARYHVLDIDQDTVDLSLSATGIRQAKALGVGLNWYMNAFLKWMLNFERTVFESPVAGARRPENALLFRNQVSF